MDKVNRKAGILTFIFKFQVETLQTESQQLERRDRSKEMSSPGKELNPVIKQGTEFSDRESDMKRKILKGKVLRSRKSGGKQDSYTQRKR